MDNNMNNKINKNKNINEDNLFECNEIAMYIFVNNDLKMEKGKIASQVGHGVASVIQQLEQWCYEVAYPPEYCTKYKIWNKTGHAKLVLKATQEQMIKLTEYPNARHIIDQGRTQIESNSLTVVAFFPEYKKKMKSITEGYKLL